MFSTCGNFFIPVSTNIILLRPKKKKLFQIQEASETFLICRTWHFRKIPQGNLDDNLLVIADASEIFHNSFKQNRENLMKIQDCTHAVKFLHGSMTECQLILCRCEITPAAVWVPRA